VTRILTSAQNEPDEVFLCLLTEAYTGCRVSEIADCSTLDFNFVKNGDQEEVIPGKWFLYVGENHREPGCTTKGHKSRGIVTVTGGVQRVLEIETRFMRRQPHLASGRLLRL
jgi:hypothetical protein